MNETRYSKPIKQNITIDKSAGIIIAEDGTKYNSKELKLLKGSSDEMLMGAHKFKKLFNGEVFEIEDKTVPFLWE